MEAFEKIQRSISYRGKLTEIHRALARRHSELMVEYRSVPLTFFGGLRPRHREIIAAATAVFDAAQLIYQASQSAEIEV